MTDVSQVAEIGWSAEGRLVSARGACRAVFGETPERLIGRPLQALLGLEDGEVAQLSSKVPPGGEVVVEFLPCTLRNECTVARLALVREGAQLRAGVMDMRQVLLGAPPLQIAALSSSLSHEIRNPLSSVKMAVQTLARNTGLSERDRRRLSIANREVRTIERMLWLLSEYGRDTPPVLEPMPLRAVLQEAAALVEPELRERATELDIREEAGLPHARIDAGRLRPVLAQMLLNVAIGQPEGAKVTVQLRQSPEGGCELLLPDPAAALPPEERATLFEPFGSRLARGAGLSLAALHRVMLGHRGTVEAEGGAAPGTVFKLMFPP